MHDSIGAYPIVRRILVATSKLLFFTIVLLSSERYTLDPIIDYLKLHGEQLDVNLASALERPLEQIRSEIRVLSEKGAIMMCFVTRFRQGIRTEGFTCRVSGVIPAPAPGRRPSTTKS